MLALEIPVYEVQALTITGPFNATGAGDTPSRREIFVCRPGSVAEETPCAERILSRLATRAYRYPVGAEEVAELMQFYRMGRDEGGDFEVGIQYALSRMLADPRFLYRFEREPADIPAGSVYRISDLELASRISLFQWISIPDAEPTVVTTPIDDVPVISIKALGGGKLKISVRSAHDTGRASVYKGANGIKLKYKILDMNDPAPNQTGELTEEISLTRAISTIDLGNMISGKKIYIAGQWFVMRNQNLNSPMSTIQNSLIL
jgi:hypothetical protein